MATLQQASTVTKDDKSQLLNPQPIYSFTSKHQKQQNDAVSDDDLYHIKQCYHQRAQQQHRAAKTPQHSSCFIIPQTSDESYSIALPACHHLRNGYNCNTSTAAAMRWLLIVMTGVFVVLHSTVLSSGVMAAPQSCILCDKNDLIAKDPQMNYEEFLFEHQVTRHDAINALKQLNESFYKGSQADSSCNAVRCTDKVNKYCLGPQFINDHCYCEFGHGTDGLPFVPHICYVGEKVYKASVGSCFFYEEVKECCCSSLLAKEWRHISSASSLHSNATTTFYCNFVLVIGLLYLLIRRLHF